MYDTQSMVSPACLHFTLYSLLPPSVSYSPVSRPWCWEGLGAGGEGDDRGWDGWMASPTRWMWVWVSSGSWWWTGRPGMLQFMESQRVRHDQATELNFTLWFRDLSHMPSSLEKWKNRFCQWYDVFLQWVGTSFLFLEYSLELHLKYFLMFTWMISKDLI